MKFKWPWSKKESITTSSDISFGVANQAVFTPRNYKNFADEAYVLNAISHRCISLIAQAIATVPVLLMDKRTGKSVQDHPILQLFKNPSPQSSYYELMISLTVYYLLSGNTYIESVGPGSNKPPRELWTIRPDRMKVIAGKNGTVAGYKYEVDGQSVRWNIDARTGRAMNGKGSEIIHIKRFHPTNDWYGLSAVEPAAYAIDRHNESGKHNMAVLQNGARPSGALIFKTQKGAQGEDVNASDELIKMAKEALSRNHVGSKNSGKPMVFGGNVDWLQIGLDMQKMQLTESKMDAAYDICIGHGVPIPLVLPGQSTYNNMREANLGFYEMTVLPIMGHFLSRFNSTITVQFDDNLQFEPDLDSVQALAVRREKIQSTALDLYKNGIITRTEAREILQYEPDSGNVSGKIDPQVITALTQNLDTVGYEPLYNYLLSVGLLSDKVSLEEFINSPNLLFGATQNG